MQTNFSLAQLADPEVADAEAILRKCVHCGLCTATCSTYVTLGSELDSPRGRIYLIKDMYEKGLPADKQVATHIDRCLSCLSCTTTCPSGVDYMHLIDQTRAYVEKTYKRPLADKLARWALGFVLPHPARFRAALKLARLGKPFAGVMKRVEFTKAFGHMLDLAPARLPAADRFTKPGTHVPKGAKRGRVAILSGCAQPVLKPEVNAATIELLTNLGVEVVAPEGEVCCGSLTHHMGREHDALTNVRTNVDVWTREIEAGGLDAIIITASGCGTTIKDYGHMLARDPAYAEKAAKVAALAKDVTEYLAMLDLPAGDVRGLNVTYHSACSMQHGQKIVDLPPKLLTKAGFTVREPAEKHLCCGSAGTYNMLQPEISAELKARKLRNIKATRPAIIATGNIGCITQLEGEAGVPLVHTIELLNWAYGGKKPLALE